MFKYIKFEKVTDDVTTYEFRASNDDVKVNHFDVDVVSLECESETLIDVLIAAQDEIINCIEISKEEFKELVKDSAQIERIRTVVKERIASKYSIADEIAMMKKDIADEKRVAYESYVFECVAVGDELKALVGY